MTYVIANPHGSYTQFVKLLEDINFGKDDVMFVLGDIVDYGSEPMDLLCDLSFRENIWAISGEHDRLAYRMLKGFDDMLKNGNSPDADYIAEMTEWVQNGGKTTLDTFRALENDMREGVLEYLEELPAYEIIDVGGKEWLLVHSSIEGFNADVDFEEYDPDAFCADNGMRNIEGYTVVCGHLPTTENFASDGKIYHGDGFVAVDCGVARGGRLACLCLDNGEEYYV
ncbi:MAG: metallophosphoesterase [Eubacteriales bacterium]